jgi:hypothetical protein
MNKFLLLFVSASFAVTPEWTTNVPLGFSNDYKVCYANDPKEDIAEAKAMESCIKEFLMQDKIFVEKNEVSLVRKNNKLELTSKLKYNTSKETIENLRIVDKYSGIENDQYKAYVLLSQPKKEPLAIPDAGMVSTKEFLFPGWGSSSLGQKDLSNSRYFNSMTLILASAVSYYIMADAYHDANTARTTEDFRLYRDKAIFYRNWTVGFSVSYLIYATYCSIDVKSSKYLLKYI